MHTRGSRESAWLSFLLGCRLSRQVPQMYTQCNRHVCAGGWVAMTTVHTHCTTMERQLRVLSAQKVHYGGSKGMRTYACREGTSSIVDGRLQLGAQYEHIGEQPILSTSRGPTKFGIQDILCSICHRGGWKGFCYMIADFW
jgi:hypothetical protein